jgi:hypothetical protein
MRAVLLLLALFCVGCLPKKIPEFVPAHSRKVVVKLADSLGIITMYIPERYDTGFSWLHYSDCKPCHEMKCRFQSTLSEIQMEDGYLWTEQRDCFEQLTIIYEPYDNPPPRHVRRMDTTGMYQNRAFGQHLREQKKYWRSNKQLVLDTCYNIYDRPLYATAIREYDADKKRYTYLLTAETFAWSREIEFKFKLVTDKQDSVSANFIKNAAEIIQTIRLSSPFSFGR